MGSYIGREPTTGHFPVDNFTSSGGSTYTLSKAPASAGAIEVSVQGILQPTTAYSVSGTTLTLAGVANNVNIFVRHLGETLTLPTIADGVVTTSKLAVDAVGVAELSATGTASNTTFLRGDNSWQTAGSTSASDLTSGTLPDGRFPDPLPARSGANLTSLSAANIVTVGMVATGGTITTHGDYKIHTFLASSTPGFTVTTLGHGKVEYLVVAGGGGAGGQTSGGGGGGGFRTGKDFAVQAQAYSIVVGAGGANNNSSPFLGSVGGNSSFSTITSTGGGYTGPNDSTPSTGGSGGGASATGGSRTGASGNTPAVQPPQGHKGGNDAGYYGYTGGGGGAGSEGESGNSGLGWSGDGGHGAVSDISGVGITYAGGGGGGLNVWSTIQGQGGRGGIGGGGHGGTNSTTGPWPSGNKPATIGRVNSGGGGGSGNSTGCAGGSGIVIIRYKFQ